MKSGCFTYSINSYKIYKDRCLDHKIPFTVYYIYIVDVCCVNMMYRVSQKKYGVANQQYFTKGAIIF